MKIIYQICNHSVQPYGYHLRTMISRFDAMKLRKDNNISYRQHDMPGGHMGPPLQRKHPLASCHFLLASQTLHWVSHIHQYTLPQHSNKQNQQRN